MEELDILETQLRRVELQERIQGIRLQVAEARAKEAELVRLKEETLLKARRLKDEPTAVQMAPTSQKGERTRAEPKEGARFPGLSSRPEAGERRGEFYVAATSALEAEPDSRPGERFAKTGLSYGPLKSGRGSAGILEFDARSETGRSHASFGQESRRVSYMSAAAEYAINHVATNPSELIERAALAAIDPSKETKAVQVSLDSGKYQPDIGFKLGDLNCDGVEHIASVRNHFVRAAKVAGIGDFVESLNAALCATPADHERATLIIERIVGLAKEAKTYTQAHNYLTNAPRFAISILKTLVKLVDNGEPTVYGRALEGDGNISEHKRLEELLLAMDRECANKATVEAVFQMFTKLHNLAKNLPEAKAGCLMAWVDSIRKQIRVYQLMPARAYSVDYLILQSFMVSTMASSKLLPQQISVVATHLLAEIPKGEAAKDSHYDADDFYRFCETLRDLDRDATWPGKKQGPGNHPNISATSGHGGTRSGKGKGGDGGNGKGGGDDGGSKGANKTNKGSVRFKELPKECLLCAGNHTIKECPYKHDGPRRDLAKKLEEGKALRAQKRTEKLTPAFAKLLNDIDAKAEEIASRAARAEAKDTTVQTTAARNFGVPEYWDSDDGAICEDTECPVDWVDAPMETVDAGGTTGPFGYVSAAISKTARATAEGFAGSVVKMAGSVTACSQKVFTGKVALHPDSAQATPMLKDERRAVRKQLLSKPSFSMMHMLGMITAAAYPVKDSSRSGKNIVAVQTRNKARGAKGAAGETSLVSESEEDDEGI
jgi:uncharacterized membrane protein YgcG